MKTFKSYLTAIQESDSFLFPEIESEATENKKREATEKLKRLIAAQLRTQGHNSDVVDHIENLSHEEISKILREVVGGPVQPRPIQQAQSETSDTTTDQINPHEYGYDPHANLAFDPTKLFTKET